MWPQSKRLINGNTLDLIHTTYEASEASTKVDLGVEAYLAISQATSLDLLTASHLCIPELSVQLDVVDSAGGPTMVFHTQAVKCGHQELAGPTIHQAQFQAAAYLRAMRFNRRLKECFNMCGYV